MDIDRQIITVELDGIRYRGAYTIERANLVVEAHGLGRKETDACLVDYRLGPAAERLASLLFMELVKEHMGGELDLMELVAQGATTQITLIGAYL